MIIKNEIITKGFILSGLINLFAVLFFSRFFTNPVIAEFDPQAMSNFGLLMIMVWGLVFIAVSKDFYKVKWLVGVFVIEKLIYATQWARWMMDHHLSDVFAKDTMAGVFYSIYGINDALFCIFFLIVFVQLLRTQHNR